MNIIVAADNNWAIGNRNRLLVSIPRDQKNFREETTGKVVVLGRKTLETFPQGQPLQYQYHSLQGCGLPGKRRHSGAFPGRAAGGVKEV